MQWDQVLMDYCRGRRDHPVWAIAGSDFHEEQKGIELDTFQTIFLVHNQQRKDILQALERGRIYAVLKSIGSRLNLDQFQVKDESNGHAVTMGEEINIKGSPVIEGRLSVLDGSTQKVAISIIRGGKPAWTLEGQTPLDFQLVDRDGWNGKTFYRQIGRAHV